MPWTRSDVAAYEARQRPKGQQGEAEAVPDGQESQLHADIKAECKRRGWLAFHGSMAHRTRRTLGEPDFVIMADRGLVFFIECKAKNGKSSPAQNGVRVMARLLGHTVYEVRSFEQFLEIVK